MTSDALPAGVTPTETGFDLELPPVRPRPVGPLTLIVAGALFGVSGPIWVFDAMREVPSLPAPPVVSGVMVPLVLPFVAVGALFSGVLWWSGVREAVLPTRVALRPGRLQVGARDIPVDARLRVAMKGESLHLSWADGALTVPSARVDLLRWLAHELGRRARSSGSPNLVPKALRAVTRREPG